MRVCLVLLAEGTALDIASYEGSESGPPEFRGDQLMSFQEAGVACRLMIMATFQDCTAEGVVCRDVDAAFVSKDAGFDLPVSEPGTEGERNVLVYGLEGLQNEGVPCGGGFNAVGEGGVNQVDKEGRWEEGNVSVVRVIRGEEVGSAGEGVGASEKFSGYMDHLEVKVSKVNEPSCLAAVECLGLAKVGEVFVVGEDLYGKRGTMEVMVPGLQGADDSKEFAIIDIIVTLGRREGL